MKVVILAGGLGTRLSEYTKTIPKPMVKIANKPIIYHIMKLYAKYGFKDFLIATSPYLLGWIIYFVYTQSDPIKNFFEPLQWILKTGYARDGDIYSILNNYFFSDLEYYYRF